MARRMVAPVRVNPVLLHPQERRMSLDGRWSFRLDPDDRGIKERWFEDIGVLGDQVAVPGCWQGQGFGGDGKDLLWDFRLEARTFRATYEGTGWYGRRFRVQDEWKGRRLWLNFGGAHPSAEVWLNGVRLGENNLPFAPFGFEVTDLVRFDGENRLAVRVHEENRVLGLAFNWQGNWSGLYRGVELTATGPQFIEGLRAHADVDGRAIRFDVRLGDFGTAPGPTILRLSVQHIGGKEAPLCAQIPVASDRVRHVLPVPSPHLWRPETPNLYRVDAELSCDDSPLDVLSERVGFVKLSTEGKHFLINGRPYYMRGSGDFLSNPETGCPDTDRDRWRKKLKALREYGYNYVRCQSYVYAPEYFDAADEAGLLVQSEMGMLGGWAGNTQWHVYAWPPPTPAFREALKRQWDLVVARDVNHPSANLYCMSNELGAGTEFPRAAWQCYRDTKAIKPTALVIWTDGGYNADLPADFVNWEGLNDAKCSKPLIQHEFRWWSSFPDVRIMHKYSGALRPYAAEIAMEAAERHGIRHILPLAAANSQRLQLVEAKGKMEMCRRDNPRLAGICHFNAMDSNPSPQGILDEFYEKKCTDAATWLQTNGDTVILSSLGFAQRVLAEGDVLKCALFVSDFSHPPLGAPVVEWRLVTGETTLKAGTVEYRHEPYHTCPAGNLETTVPAVLRPVRAGLRVTLRDGGRAFTNAWDLWLFPKDSPLHAGVRVYGAPQHTWLKGLQGVASVSPADLASPAEARVVLSERLDDALVRFARAGGRVILAASEGLLRPFRPKLGLSVGRYFFTPPANYAPYEDGHDGTIIADHPMLGDLPHEGFADLQFYRMIGESPPLDLEPLGLSAGDPVIRAIHSYPVCRPLGYLVEGSLGRGGVIVCALDLNQSWPEARHLLARMCRYAAGEGLRSATELSEAAVEKTMKGTALP